MTMKKQPRKQQLLFITALLLSLTKNNNIIVSSASVDNEGNTQPSTAATLRIFQTLPNDPSEMSPMELDEMHRRLRATRAMVFGSGMTSNNDRNNNNNLTPTLEIYTPAERRNYLVKNGGNCYPPNTNIIESSLQWNDVLSRYDSFMSYPVDNNSHDNNLQQSSKKRRLDYLAIELWKYCVLYNGDGHVYLAYEEAQLLYPLKTVLNDVNANYAVVSSLANHENNNINIVNNYNNDDEHHHLIHDSFMAISPYNPAKLELLSMLQYLLETANDVLELRPMLPSRMMYQTIIEHEQKKKISNDGNEDDDEQQSWSLLQSHCIDLAKDTKGDSETITTTTPMDGMMVVGSGTNVYAALTHPSSSTSSSRLLALQLPQFGGDAVTSTTDSFDQVTSNCPLSGGGYCCLAFQPNDDIGRIGSESPVIALRHPLSGGVTGSSSTSSPDSDRLPYKWEPVAQPNIDSTARVASKPTLNLGVIPVSDLSYISTVRLHRNHTASAPTSPITRFPNHPANSPNFFDILFENDCLPYSKECLRCFKDVSNEANIQQDQDEEVTMQTKRHLSGHQMNNACSKCQYECPCYCDVLCKIRPPPKQVVRTYSVRPPRHKKAVDRLIPKIIHQTWFEPVTKEKYPNFSRLIESWKKSGWEYYFYDDESAREFLSTHFPPEVGEAYDSITPGKCSMSIRVLEVCISCATNHLSHISYLNFFI